MTSDQLHILQHSLGRDQYGHGTDYRNHFCAGGADVQACEGLVASGYMRKNERISGSDLAGGDPVYHVTEAGKRYVTDYSPKPPKGSRSAARYAEWLEVADVFPGWKFFDWIKAGGYKPEVRERWRQESQDRWDRMWGGGDRAASLHGA